MRNDIVLSRDLVAQSKTIVNKTIVNKDGRDLFVAEYVQELRRRRLLGRRRSGPRWRAFLRETR
jgi:hypothetical protein